jgi:HAD superfamily hydrolase (TIGR01509 family)
MNKILNSFDAVIFDMDGVLVDSEPYYMDVEQTTFKELGLNISEEEHLTYQGTAYDRMWQMIKEKHEIKKTVDELVEFSVQHIASSFSALEKIEPMPGVEDLIKRLIKRNVPIALASSSYLEVITIILRRTGLDKYFEVVVDNIRAQSSKPDPDIFLLAAKELGIAPEKCAVIEDSTNGVLAAKAAGMYCIAFAGPNTGAQDHSQADLIITNFDTLF